MTMYAKEIFLNAVNLEIIFECVIKYYYLSRIVINLVPRAIVICSIQCNSALHCVSTSR
jgi:hypothetical protein